MEIDDGVKDAAFQAAPGQLDEAPSTALSHEHDALDGADTVGGQQHDLGAPDVLLRGVGIPAQSRMGIADRTLMSDGNHYLVMPRPSHNPNAALAFRVSPAATSRWLCVR